jgi:nitrate/TMAO reductase-like tetraheme cytochrome c subunit
LTDKNLIVLGVVLIIVAGASYQIGTARYERVLKEKKNKVSYLENSIEEAKQASISLKTSASAIVMEEDVDCLSCHDIVQTKSFHVPQTILKLEEEAGKRRRTCVDCHGTLGPPWSADKQMTPLSEILYNSSAGLNGVLEMESRVPHHIHKQKLDQGVVECQTCHGEGPKMNIPKPDAEKGQVLVCQNCKFHPEGGNYITIHLELASKKCTTCHTGGIIKVHKDKTEKLGQI